MNKDCLEKAKELFFRYSCSRANLHSDDRLDEYKSYDINQETERNWIIEYVKKNMDSLRSKNKITDEYSRSVSLIKSEALFDVFKELINLIDEKFYEYDALSKIKAFQPILDIYDSFSGDACLKKMAKDFIISRIYDLEGSKFLFHSERYDKYEVPASLNSQSKLNARLMKMKERLNACP